MRSGVDRVTGKPWSTKLTHDYGEIIGTNGVDDDPVDVFIGHNKSAPFVYVVHQLQKQTGEWDEDKCFLGFDDAMDAKAAYYKNYDNPDLFYGDIETIPFKVFKEKVLSHKGDTMIHASIGVGDPVVVDGLRGRGVITEVDGSDVIIRYRNGEYFKRKKYNVHNMGDNMYRSRYQTIQSGKVIRQWPSEFKRAERAAGIKPYTKAARLEPVEMERGPITVPHGTNKRIEKVGTLFCVVSDGVDKNFGCYASREQAEAVMNGKSFIEPDIPAGMYATQDILPKGWKATPKAAPRPRPAAHTNPLKSAVPREKPPATIPSQPKMAPIKKYAAPHVVQAPKTSGPTGIKSPTSMGSKPHTTFTNNRGQKLPSPGAHKTLEGFGDLGEPMAGSMGHAHIEPEFWFHPPSLENRNKADHVPTDDPGEKSDKFLDVTKRKQAHTDRMKRLKRGAPGGLPPYIPAQTSGLSTQAMYTPVLGAAKLKFKKKRNLLDVINPRTSSLRVPHQVAYTPGIKAGRTEDKRMRVSFEKQGCL